MSEGSQNNSNESVSVQPETKVDTPLQPEVSGMSGGNFLSSEKINKLKSASPWQKVYAILLMIDGGIIALIGIPALFFLVGLVIIPLGVLIIFMGIKVWRAASATDEIADTNTQEVYQQKSYEALISSGFYFKVQGIIIVVGFVLSIIMVIIAIIFSAFSAALFNDMSERAGIDQELTQEEREEADRRFDEALEDIGSREDDLNNQ